jgi:hypothetical protein
MTARPVEAAIERPISALKLYGGVVAEVTFLSQKEPVDEYGRALYAVSRSILRALLDQLSVDDLTDLNTDRGDVTLRQLAKVVRLDRDKGMRGDGFEWAVHEAIVGREPTVTEPVADALGRACAKLRNAGEPESLLFGYERAKYLGFLDAVIEEAGAGAILLADGSGKPFHFGPWVRVAARGELAEAELRERIKKIWKTDLFLTAEGSWRWAAATIKSNWHQLEDGPGLRVAIVPEAKDLSRKRRRHQGLHLAVLPDPDGFIGLFNDAYEAMAHAILKVGKQPVAPYWTKPSAQAQKVQEQMEKYGTVKVMDIEGALNEAAQQKLIGVKKQLVSVAPPPWLRITEQRTAVLAPKPSFVKLD